MEKRLTNCRLRQNSLNANIYMKTAELRQKTKSELEALVRDSREKLRQLYFDLSAGKVKNVREIRRMKKEIARTLTLIRNIK